MLGTTGGTISFHIHYPECNSNNATSVNDIAFLEPCIRIITRDSYMEDGDTVQELRKENGEYYLQWISGPKPLTYQYPSTVRYEEIERIPLVLLSPNSFPNTTLNYMLMVDLPTS